MDDYLITTIAILAFLLSLVTAYYQFILKVVRVRATPLGFALRERDDIGTVLVLGFVFSNSGNATATLTEIKVGVPSSHGETFSPWDRFIQENVEYSRYPITLGPGKNMYKEIAFKFPSHMLKLVPSTPSQLRLKSSVVDPFGVRHQKVFNLVNVTVRNGRITEFDGLNKRTLVLLEKRYPYYPTYIPA